MTQHYLRSAAYRDFSIHSIYGMSDDEIHAMFARLRWAVTPTRHAQPAVRGPSTTGGPRASNGDARSAAGISR